jgi:hypothetical protein
MKKLYKVTATFEYAFICEEGREARMAPQYAQEAMNDISQRDIDISTEPYTENCIDGWDEFCRPYGDSEHKTTGEWLEILK